MEEELKQIIIRNLNKIKEFNCFKSFKGIKTNEQFIELIGRDPAFAPFYLNRDKYVTARIGGNLVTSLHRKLGDLYQELVQHVLSEKLGLSLATLKYSITLTINEKVQTRSTDGRIMLSDLKDENIQRRIRALIPEGYNGLALEVRSCYQIGDSKRIQADRDMALALKGVNIYPIMLVFCITSLKQPIKRLSSLWELHQGKEAFDMVNKLTEFNLYHFLNDNSKFIKSIMDEVFEKF